MDAGHKAVIIVLMLVAGVLLARSVLAYWQARKLSLELATIVTGRAGVLALYALVIVSFADLLAEFVSR